MTTENKNNVDTTGEANESFISETNEDTDYETDDEETYWYDCIFCKMIFESHDDRAKHMIVCKNK